MHTQISKYPFGHRCEVRSMLRHYAVIVLLTMPLACMEPPDAHKPAKQDPVQNTDNDKIVFNEVGSASWYGPGFRGHRTASGEKFNQNALTAAHLTLPMGTKAEVTNLDNGKKVEVKINDRGPYANGRAIDLSRAATRQLDMQHDGTSEVKITVKPLDNKPAILAKIAEIVPKPAARIKAVQQTLCESGYPISVDGHFGNATRKALIQYQKAHDLTSSGKADANTLASMNVP